MPQEVQIKKETMQKVLAFVLLILILSCEKEETPPPAGNNLYFPPLSGDAWETLSPESLQWNTAGIPALYTLLEENGTRAFILLKDGKIVLEKYFGKNILGLAPFDKGSDWYWASAGKTLTAFTVGKAREEGFLSLSDKTSAYLGAGWTSLTPQQESAITVRHQLTMTTGLDDGVADNHSFKPADLVFKAAPGTRWAYHNAPYTLLDQVIQKAAGKPFETYFNEKLRDRIGMNGTWRWLDNDHVYFSTARSMARFGLLMLARGNWNGTPILNDGAYYEEMITTSQNLNLSYGYLWWLNGKASFRVPGLQIAFPGSITPNAPADMFSGIGKNGQYVSVIPSQNLVMVRMGENPDSAQVPFLFQNDIWEKLNGIIR